MGDRAAAAARWWSYPLIGIGIAGYLTYPYRRGFDPICAVGHGCER